MPTSKYTLNLSFAYGRQTLTACAVLATAPSFAVTLPTVCVSGTCGSTSSFVGSGQAGATVAGNTLTVTQTSEQAILNWSSFNISADGKVVFKQPDSNAIALNQIFQASPSQIFGLLQANGQVYLVNQNGFIFGSTATVNVGGLLASTLPLTQPLGAGLLAALQNTTGAPFAALQSDGRVYAMDPTTGKPVLGADGQQIPVEISVQPGAQITAANGSRIMLAGQEVTNGGTLTAPDGQVILAAGQSVYIQASTDPNLRGLIVEVDNPGVTTPPGASTTAGSHVGLSENQAQGSISVSEGNVTLVGLAVNQQGRISATTSVTENGSILLVAQDSVQTESGAQPNGTFTIEAVPQRGGQLTLGPQSLTTVLPDTASTQTTVASVAQPPSIITLAGKTVELTDGSQVIAPGGEVSVLASSDPGVQNAELPTLFTGNNAAIDPALTKPDPGAQLRIDSGAVIDVSGSTVSVPVTTNLVTLQLLGSELADDPLLRNGPLHGATVVVDARADGGLGTPVADVAGDIALIQSNVLERTTQGGSIKLDSTGDVVVASGAKLNVSGGQVDYTPGIMQTSMLTLPDGAVVDIGSASPNQVYTGVVNPQFKSISDQWGIVSFIPTPGIAYYDPGYVQGSSAGSIQVMGSSMVLNGTFLGQAVNGIYQRSGSGVASGGTFTIGGETTYFGAPPSPTPPNLDFHAPAVELVNTAPNVVVASGADLPSDLPVELSTNLLSAGGFTNLQISSNDRITIPAGVPVSIGPGGSLILQAPQIDIDSTVTIPAGTIQATSVITVNDPAGQAGLGVFVGDGARFDVSGMWTNDTLVPLGVTPTGFAMVNAGSVELNQNVLGDTLSVGSNVEFLANGGAQLQSNGQVLAGKGGNISLLESALLGSPGTDTFNTVTVGNADVVQGFGVDGALGGSFTLEVPRLQVGSGDTTWLRAQTADSDPTSSSFFKVDASLFSDFGFSSFTLTANGPTGTTTQDVLQILPQTSINLEASTLELNSTLTRQPSGAALTSFATETLLPGYLRSPTQLTLQAVPADDGSITPSQIGNFTVGAGASITADPGSTIALASTGSLTFDGSIDAPSGIVNLSILAPPTGGTESRTAFSPTLQLELGPQALIDVAGTVVYQPNQTGVLSGNVLPGGSVTLAATQGAVVTDPGSVINFSGTQAPLDLPVGVLGTTIQEQMVASAAGSLTVSSEQAISLLGKFEGEPGTGTTGRAAGGTLTLAMSVNPNELSATSGFEAQPLITAPLVIDVQTDPQTAAVASDSGIAILSTQQLASSGVDTLNLFADSGVAFANGTQLSLARSVSITTPAIIFNAQGAGNGVSVTAPYIALGSANMLTAAASGNLPSTGSGNISFNATEIDLVGSLAFQNMSSATLTSSGQILLRGETNSAEITTTSTGSVSIEGNLTLSAAQVVPTTGVNFTINATGGPDNTVQFVQNGSVGGTPLSVDGSLTVNANHIIQGGTIWAPFGQLTFAATDDLTFEPGSLTSVSGNSTVLPYGEVQNGNAWVYQVSQSQSAPATVSVLPSRQISATGGKVTLSSGATVDVSGGGDLTGYEWTPGTGGTLDVLSNSQSPGLYAIVPSLLGQTAPYDPMMWAGSNLAPNESIYISGGGGLAAGIYPLLPARYALLPGAYLVSEVSGDTNLRPGVTLQATNGYPIVSGYITYGNTGIGDTQTNGFLIEPGTYSSTLANYTNVLASTFFAGVAGSEPSTPTVPSSLLPADGGIFVVSAQNGFSALGKVAGGAAQGGTGATVEINATQIEVDPSVAALGSKAGTTYLASSVLDTWDVGRLWLGLESEPASSSSGSAGSSSASGSVATTPVTVTASSVEVTTGSNLTAPEIILAATGTVQVDSGASVTTTSVANPTESVAAASAAATDLSLAGSSAGAAILAASDLTYWVPTRTGATAGQGGTITVASGASVGSRGSLTFDAPNGGTLADGTLSGVGAQWSFGTSEITFGQQGSAPGGFAIDSNLVAALQSAATVRLSSTSAIDLLQPVNLSGAAGGTGIGEIDILAPGINNEAGAGNSTFTAGLITLTGGSSATTPQAGTGNLSFVASEIDVGPGDLALSGFAATTLDASNVIAGVGTGSLATAGNLNLLTPILTAQSDSQTQITAGGSITLAASSRPSVGAAPTLQAGGTLSLSGSSITDSTSILMPAGEVSLNATQQLVVASGAAIDVAGVNPANAAHGSDGGSISFNSGGNLTVASGSSLSVASGNGANAGAISVVAGGVADIEAQLDGSASAGQSSGSFTLQAGSLVNFAALNDNLEQSGFHQTRSIEVGSGDLDLAAGSSITAQNVVLTADSGAITIAGTINASGASGGGNVTLSAHNSMYLLSTANIAANGLGQGSAGGQIELASVAGSVVIDPVSQISAQGSGGTGTLLVRAPEVTGGNDVSITSLPTNLTHIGSVILEPEFSPASVNSANFASQLQSIESNISAYMAAAEPNILSRLGVGTASNVVVRPYVDITAQGNLTLPSEDFSTWRFDGQPADISIRATGSLTVNGTVSDGFYTNPNTGALDVFSSGSSARISLVAGANLNSASATAVVSGAAAQGSDLVLNPNAIVRTGTGAIELTAAEDVVFGQGASVYTGGIQGIASTTNTDIGVPVSFATNGGNITVNAGRNIIGAPVTEAVDQWNPRYQASNQFSPGASSNPGAFWGIDFQEFNWNIGALGGGNVTLNAGGNVTDVSAAVADSRAFVSGSAGNVQYDPGSTTSMSFGGGNLTVNAGGNIGSGLFYVGNGVGRINAGGGLTSTLPDAAGPALGNVGTLLLAGDASFYVSAQQDIQLAGMVSATAIAPSENSDSVYFFRYDPNSILSVQSNGGTINYGGTSAASGTGAAVGTFLGVVAQSQTDPGSFQAAPPSLDFASYGGDVLLNQTLYALPSLNGQLTVYAARDVTASSLGMSDQPLSTIPTADNATSSNQIFSEISLTYTGASLHQDDPNPIQIAAGQDILDSTFSLPKQADISAGRDIVGLTLNGQNLNPNDATVVSAGRNISYADNDASSIISVTGPGQLDVIAGGSIDLGSTQGITTLGNTINPNLASSTGASVSVIAGLGAPLDVGSSSSSTGFLGKVIAPSSAYQTMLESYVEQQTGQTNLSYSTAATEFQGFSVARQLPLIENVFFNELDVSDTEANAVPSLGYGRGYDAIDALFPGSRTTSTSPYSGDITLGYSRIYTLDGGSISLFAPGGGINVGFAVAPAIFAQNNITRTPSDLGIVAVQSGDVNIYTLNDIEVNQSRVFTLGGGNITIWSDLGNIDAGNGAKTAISAPPPTVEVSSDGNVTLDFAGAVAGSGIRVIQSLPDVPAGDVFLIAPVGDVISGDAGIGSAGNITIAAEHVIGASNINFGGTAVGIPPETSGIGASLVGASSVANSSSTAQTSSFENGPAEAANTAPVASASLNWLEVFVEGFGDEACKAEDAECLKRNQK